MNTHIICISKENEKTPYPVIVLGKKFCYSRFMPRQEFLQGDVTELQNDSSATATRQVHESKKWW